MLTAAKRYLKLIYKYKLVNLSSAMEYKASFFTQVIGMAINNASFLVVWVALFNVKQDIGGYDFKMVLLLWAISSSGFGFAHIVFGKANKIMEAIINGELDIYLIQPKNLLINLTASETSISAIGDLIYGYIILIVIRADLYIWLAFTILVVITGIITAMFSVIVHSLAFYLKNIEDFVNNAVMFLISFSIYPEGIFTGFTRLLLYTLIPAAFTSFIPVNIIKNFDIISFLILIGYMLLETTIAFVLFYNGLKKYTSGNLINTRM